MAQGVTLSHWLCYAALMFVMLIPCGSIQAQTPPLEAFPASDDRVLFAAGNPELWSIRQFAQKGGEVKLTPESALQVKLTKPESGAGVLVRNRFDATPYLSDAHACVEVIFQQPTLSESQQLQVQFRTQNRRAPEDKKNFSSSWRSAKESVNRSDGSRCLRFSIENVTGFTSDDEVLSVAVVGREPGELTISRIAIQRLRNVAFQIVNPYETYMNRLEIQGQTLDPKATVTLKLTDGSGSPQVQQAKAVGGKFSLTWTNPPLTAGRNNTLVAKVGPGDMDATLPLAVFGYRTNNDYVWLRVKGKQIVTSPLSAGGEQPFIPVGVGYARDVIIPAQDEQVMAFCKAQHLNTIRLPFYTRFFNNAQEKPIDLDYHIKTFIDPVIQAAKRHGLYVILDDHGYFSGKIDEAKARQQQAGSRWDEAGVNEWVARWARVADYYKNEPYVLGYELCNEPHDIGPEIVRDWYGRALKAIRKVDTRHIVLAGTCDWSHSRALEKTWGGVASSFDAPYNNMVFAFHDYPEDNHPWIVQKHITQFRDTYNVPVLCTEFGATWWDKDETVCREFQAGMLALFARENVGWMIWALSGTNNNPRNATPLPDKVRKEKNIPRLPKSEYDSCAYSDIWRPVAHIMSSPFPEPQK